MSSVVNLHLHPDRSRAQYDVYIGRRVRFHEIFTEDSKWHNPFPRREGSLEDYERHIRETPELWNALEELEGKVLGCWCVDTDSIEPPLQCHGQVLMRLLREKKQAIPREDEKQE